MLKYTVIIEKAKNNYSAYCPDLPGCIATGHTVKEATQNMKEALKFHLETLRDEKATIPKPSIETVSIEITA